MGSIKVNSLFKEAEGVQDNYNCLCVENEHSWGPNETLSTMSSEYTLFKIM